MFTSQLLLLKLQVSLSTSLAIATSPDTSGLLLVVPEVAPMLETNSSSLHLFNASLGDPPDPVEVLWAQNRYLTTFHSYSEPSLPGNSLRAFVDQAISSLSDLRKANHDELDDPIPGGMFRYEAQMFSPLLISFHLASDPPRAAALTYYETAGVIASLAQYMRKWGSKSPASAALELWKGDGTASEQKAVGYIVGSSGAVD